MIECNKVYVLCPANVKSGGPELLHQLVFQLNKIFKEQKAYITYYNLGKTSPVEPSYNKYINNNWITEDQVEDNPENLVVIPETGLSEFEKFKKIQKAIWWLSVDNFLNTNKFSFLVKQVGLLHAVAAKLKGNIKDRSKLIYKANYHFYQSYYAKDFLMKNAIDNSKMFYLSDYINDKYVNKRVSALSHYRNDVVLYNPKKGIKFTRKIMDAAPTNIKFLPLINMTNNQVYKNLISSKVYIDFGNHPGKDRFPREAAILGCCVITGKRGAAGYEKDVPISSKYKFDDTEKNIPKIINKIQDCVENYNVCIKSFKNYRKFIVNEKDEFIKDCKDIFLE